MYFISFLFALLWNGPHQCIAVIYIMFLFVILSFANVNAENIMQKIVASDNVGRFGYSVSMHNNTALVGSYDMMGSSGSAYIFDRIETVNNNSGWTQTTKLVANDSVAPGDFGISVSIDNNIALIASFGDAYIFEKQININQVLWTQTARLVPNDGTAFINFGYSVSIHNNSALISSHTDDAMAFNSGSAYIFEKVNFGTSVSINNNIALIGKLVANDGIAGDQFGMSVSIDNNIALIASFGDAYIFEKQININQVLWTQTARLVPNDGTAFINFGYSVSIHNNSALIGWPGNGIDSGSAYIFEKVNEIWIQTAKLVPNDAANDHFGTSVSIHNNIALIGSPSPGHAYIFEKVNGAWTQTAKLVANDGVASDNFGTSVSINNNIALIGSPYNDDMGSNSGSAYIFEKDATWTQTAKLVANDGIAGDQFGMSVSIDNNIALIASFGDAYIFEKQININQVLWTQTARLVPNGGTASDAFGMSVSIHNNIALIGS
eukprot:549766_1